MREAASSIYLWCSVFMRLTYYITFPLTLPPPLFGNVIERYVSHTHISQRSLIIFLFILRYRTNQLPAEHLVLITYVEYKGVY